jgi:hypothetical protein
MCSGITCAKGGTRTTLSDWGAGQGIPQLNPTWKAEPELLAAPNGEREAAVDDETSTNEDGEATEELDLLAEFNENNPWSQLWVEQEQERDPEPQLLLQNLRESVELNSLHPAACAVAHLDWHTALDPVSCGSLDLGLGLRV